jgi:hypothetical protein
MVEGDDGLFMDHVFHKAVIKVDEEGTEAAPRQPPPLARFKSVQWFCRLTPWISLLSTLLICVPCGGEVWSGRLHGTGPRPYSKIRVEDRPITIVTAKVAKQV